MTPAIETDRLVKRYGDRYAVRDLDLRVETGEIFGFVGPNGAGKTTTIAMLLGAVRPTSGAYMLLGVPGDNPRVRRRVGATIEFPAAYGHLTGRQNLALVAALKGASNAHVEAALDAVDLAGSADVATRTYSLGTKQRLGLAAALLGRPELLILDEPTNGLDPDGIRKLREFLAGVAADGTTVFFASHSLGEVERLCGRVAFVDNGRLIAMGTTDELREAATGDGSHGAPAPTLEDAFVELMRQARMGHPTAGE